MDEDPFPLVVSDCEAYLQELTSEISSWSSDADETIELTDLRIDEVNHDITSLEEVLAKACQLKPRLSVDEYKRRYAVVKELRNRWLVLKSQFGEVKKQRTETVESFMSSPDKSKNHQNQNNVQALLPIPSFISDFADFYGENLEYSESDEEKWDKEYGTLLDRKRTPSDVTISPVGLKSNNLNQPGDMAPTNATSIFDANTRIQRFHFSDNDPPNSEVVIPIVEESTSKESTFLQTASAMVGKCMAGNANGTKIANSHLKTNDTAGEVPNTIKKIDTSGMNKSGKRDRSVEYGPNGPIRVGSSTSPNSKAKIRKSPFRLDSSRSPQRRGLNLSPKNGRNRGIETGNDAGFSFSPQSRRSNSNLNQNSGHNDNLSFPKIQKSQQLRSSIGGPQCDLQDIDIISKLDSRFAADRFAGDRFAEDDTRHFNINKDERRSPLRLRETKPPLNFSKCTTGAASSSTAAPSSSSATLSMSIGMNNEFTSSSNFTNSSSSSIRLGNTRGGGARVVTPTSFFALTPDIENNVANDVAYDVNQEQGAETIMNREKHNTGTSATSSANIETLYENLPSMSDLRENVHNMGLSFNLTESEVTNAEPKNSTTNFGAHISKMQTLHTLSNTFLNMGSVLEGITSAPGSVLDGIDGIITGRNSTKQSSKGSVGCGSGNVIESAQSSKLTKKSASKSDSTSAQIERSPNGLAALLKAGARRKQQEEVVKDDLEKKKENEGRRKLGFDNAELKKETVNAEEISQHQDRKTPLLSSQALSSIELQDFRGENIKTGGNNLDNNTNRKKTSPLAESLERQDRELDALDRVTDTLSGQAREISTQIHMQGREFAEILCGEDGDGNPDTNSRLSQMRESFGNLHSRLADFAEGLETEDPREQFFLLLRVFIVFIVMTAITWMVYSV